MKILTFGSFQAAGKRSSGPQAISSISIGIIAIFTVILNSSSPAAPAIIADFENDNGGFYSLLVERDTREPKEGKGCGLITFRSGRFSATRENLLDLNFHNKFTAIRFWAKSEDLDHFEVHFLDAMGQLHQVAVRPPEFASDGKWHQIVINDFSTPDRPPKRHGGPNDGKWYWPLTEMTITKPETHNDKGEYHLLIDQIEVDLGEPAPVSPLYQAPEVKRLLDRPLWNLETEKKKKKGKDSHPYFCSLIKIPDWIPAEKRAAPDARYYIYWAVHKGNNFIHMSWAPDLFGPYTEYRPDEGGVLRNTQVGIKAGDSDFASPDVHVPADKQKIRMYMHSHSTTYVAESEDGLNFTGIKDDKGFVENQGYYYRVWPWKNQWYALDRGGVLRKSADGYHFEEIAEVFPNYRPGVRHVGVFPNPQKPDILDIFLCRVYAQDEHIQLARLDVSDPDPAKWHLVTGFMDILRPEKGYEGADLPPNISIASSESNKRQLRDPYIYVEDGHVYLIYGIKAELGFAIAELKYQ